MQEPDRGDPFRASLPMVVEHQVLCKDCAHHREMSGLSEEQYPDDPDWERKGSAHTFAVCAQASRWKIDPVNGNAILVKAVRCRFKNKERNCPDFEALPPEPVSFWRRLFPKRPRPRRKRKV